jgi:hypothetical protein
MEQDLEDKRIYLAVLLNQRRKLQDGTRQAGEADEEIAWTQSHIRSYELLRWFDGLAAAKTADRGGKYALTSEQVAQMRERAVAHE